MSYTSINAAIETITYIATKGFKSVADLKIGDKLLIGIYKQEGEDDDGYRECKAVISSIMPNGNCGVYLSFLGVYADNSIELSSTQFVKIFN